MKYISEKKADFVTWDASVLNKNDSYYSNHKDKYKEFLIYNHDTNIKQKELFPKNLIDNYNPIYCGNYNKHVWVLWIKKDA